MSDPYKKFRTEAAARKYARRVHQREKISIVFSSIEDDDKPYYVDWGELRMVHRPNIEKVIYEGMGVFA